MSDRVILIRGGIFVLFCFCIFLFHFAKRESNIEGGVPGSFEDEENISVLKEDGFDESYEKKMYEMYVQGLLGENLCNARDAYDACHYMMVPMHYAFQSQNSEYIQMFQEYMDNFCLLLKEEKETFRSLSILDRLHSMYLAVEYMCLCSQHGFSVQESLFSFIYEESQEFTVTYTGAWESVAKYQDFWELLESLLSGEGYGNGKSFSNIITDIDLFLLAVLCDLKFVYENNEMKVDINRQTFIKAEKYVDRIFQDEIVWYADGTWELQVGAWRDHPDYLYAGISDPDKIIEGIDYRVENCSWDAGHSMRFPLFLKSYQRASLSQKRIELYEKLVKGYGDTFVKNVLVEPDKTCKYYRMNNYMNGCNGLYRFGYNEEGIGIGPYQNSVCFLLGWYAFCGNDEVLETYRITARKFPLDEEGEKIYTDPTTVREQNPIFKSQTYRQFLCYLAGKLVFE